MTIEEITQQMKQLSYEPGSAMFVGDLSGSEDFDDTTTHEIADGLLIQALINLGASLELLEAYDSVGKWYS